MFKHVAYMHVTSLTACRGPSQPSPTLQHYCRVCNIQLNSCRQARIHQEGKKHQKRLKYLKMCIETSKREETGLNVGLSIHKSLLSSGKSDYTLHHHGGQEMNNNHHSFHHSNSPSFYTAPPPVAVAAGPPPPPAAPAAPAAAYFVPTLPPNFLPAAAAQHHQFYAIPQFPAELYPVPLAAAAHHPHHFMPVAAAAAAAAASAGPNVPHPPAPPPAAMSPSLTSGFSGSGADCKSAADTSSLLSATSNGSSKSLSRRLLLQHNHHQHSSSSSSAAELTSSSSPPGKKMTSHKTVQKCEVCQVSVNSSQQLHAHLAGEITIDAIVALFQCVLRMLSLP